MQPSNSNPLERSFSIGNVHIAQPLALAPMAEVTDTYYRSLIKELGGVGLVVSEFISAEGLTRKNDRSHQMLAFNEAERPIAQPQRRGHRRAHALLLHRRAELVAVREQQRLATADDRVDHGAADDEVPRLDLCGAAQCRLRVAERDHAAIAAEHGDDRRECAA